jgi:hypothetical protein
MAIGNIPVGDEQLIDGNFINGMTQGHNNVSQSGIAAAGTNQATATQLPDRISILEVDISSASQGVALPHALNDMVITLINNTANSLTVFPAIANNSLGVQDLINNTTSVALAAHTALGFTCGKTGLWYSN